MVQWIIGLQKLVLTEPGIDGGMSKRMPGQMGMTNTINIPSIE